ncbi:MAG TPA: geopeptide radical SAM maturase [Thermodesulfobacteriota bacterium]|nr:geopeptide radical SAM maturase [Thermodesulfobacteriota bacterium]
MELSPFVNVYRSEERPGYSFLFSTKNAAKVLIKHETLQKIREGTASPDDVAVLTRLGMLTPDRHEEQQSLLGFFDSFNQKNPELTLTVVLNLDCNFACRYCYEGERKGNLYMSPDTAEALVTFVANEFPETKRSLTIDFYGGEPLLSVDMLTSISRRLKARSESSGGSYRFTLVTNGSLLKRRVVESLVPLGLHSVRITLDGPAENHNLYRPFKTGAGSFDTLIRNIKDCLGLVRVNIGGNYERDNYHTFPVLLDYLLKEGLTPDKIEGIKFDPVNTPPQTGPALIEYQGGCRSINEPWLFDASVFLREEILKRGYRTLKVGKTLCMIEVASSFVINYDGTIYKCPALIGMPELTIGSVYSGTHDYTASHQLDNWKNEQCMACSYLPLCFGGCRYATFLEQGTIAGLDCKKPFFDACLEKMVKQDVTYLLGIQSSLTTHDGNRIDLSTLFFRINQIMQKHFPEAFKVFSPPSLKKITACYRNADKLIQTYAFGLPYDVDRQDTAFDEKGLISAAMIRYVDDFIDTALWPKLSEFDPQELERKFEAFLSDGMKAMADFDPDLPDSINNLVRLELHLALHPDQKTFDETFARLFECKSFDLYYVYQKIHGIISVGPEPQKLMRVALMDYLRDFSAEAASQDTDLNLYAFIRDHHLNPRRLISYLVRVFRDEDPDGFRKALSSGLLDGLTGVDLTPPTTATSIPVHAHFAGLFSQAIILLRNLL